MRSIYVYRSILKFSPPSIPFLSSLAILLSSTCFSFIIYFQLYNSPKFRFDRWTKSYSSSDSLELILLLKDDLKSIRDSEISRNAEWTLTRERFYGIWRIGRNVSHWRTRFLWKRNNGAQLTTLLLPEISSSTSRPGLIFIWWEFNRGRRFLERSCFATIFLSFSPLIIRTYCEGINHEEMNSRCWNFAIETRKSIRRKFKFIVFSSRRATHSSILVFPCVIRVVWFAF